MATTRETVVSTAGEVTGITLGSGCAVGASDLEFAQNQALQFVFENRTSDPGSPVVGQCWFRTDL